MFLFKIGKYILNGTIDGAGFDLRAIAQPVAEGLKGDQYPTGAA